MMAFSSWLSPIIARPSPISTSVDYHNKDRNWHRYLLAGEWKGKTAGGAFGKHKVNFKHNPQYEISTKNTGRSRVLISLMQRDVRMENGQLHKDKYKQYTIGLSVANKSHKVLPKEELKTRHDDAREVTIEVPLHSHEKYVIVPFTRNAGEESPFILTLYSESPLNLHYVQNGKNKTAHEEKLEQVGGNKIDGMKPAKKQTRDKQYYEQMANQKHKNQNQKKPVHKQQRKGKFGDKLKQVFH